MFIILLLSQALLDILLIAGLATNRYWMPLAIFLIRVMLTAFYLLRGRDTSSTARLSYRDRVASEMQSQPFSRTVRSAILATGILADLTLILFDIQLGKLHP